MIPTPAPQEPLLEQILDALFADLERSEDFDLETVEKLRQLGNSDSLDSAAQVSRALEPHTGAEQ